MEALVSGNLWRPQDLVASSILFGNIFGLLNFSDLTKPNLLFDLVDTEHVFAICLCKYHLNGNMLDNTITRQGRNITRRDRLIWMCGELVIFTLSFSNLFGDIASVFLPQSNVLLRIRVR